MREYIIFRRSRKAKSRQRRKKWFWEDAMRTLSEAEKRVDFLQEYYDSGDHFEFKIVEMIENRSWVYNWK